MCCEFICEMIEYFYGYNVSGVMTVCGWDGVKLSILKSVKCRKLGTAFQETDCSPKINICAEVHFSSSPVTSKIRDL